MAFGADLRLPEQGLLLHVGPHKTGTTAIQGALLETQAELARHGVVYPLRTRPQHKAALAIGGGKSLAGDRPPEPADWDKLVAATTAAADRRVVISSEYFDDATDDVARQVVTALGGDRVHVVVTLRPLASMLPSAWQQYVRNRMRTPYRDWLDQVLNGEDGQGSAGQFWFRHHHDMLVDRWASIVGPDRVLVVVVDESDRTRLARVFERVLDLPEGLLRTDQESTNRSLTAAETELIRAINIEFHERGWSAELYGKLVRTGVVRQLQQRLPAPDEPRIATPSWAVRQANDIAAAAAERIAKSGVHVLGNLDALSAVAAPDADETPVEEAMLSVEAAKDAVAGAIIACTGAKPISAVYAVEPRTIDGTTTRQLAAVVINRVRRRLTRPLRDRRTRSGSA